MEHNTKVGDGLNFLYHLSLSTLMCIFGLRDKMRAGLVFRGVLLEAGQALSAEQNEIGVNICISAVEQQLWGQLSGIPCLFRDHCYYSWAFLGIKRRHERDTECLTPRGRKLSTNTKTKEERGGEVWSWGRILCYDWVICTTNNTDRDANKFRLVK